MVSNIIQTEHANRNFMRLLENEKNDTGYIQHLSTVQCTSSFNQTALSPSWTHQAPVVWKLTQVQAAGPRYIRGRRTIYSYFTSNANRWAPGRMFSSIKSEDLVQISRNHKHIFITFADVRCGQESVSKQPWYILPAVTHAFRRVRK